MEALSEDGRSKTVSCYSVNYRVGRGVMKFAGLVVLGLLTSWMTAGAFDIPRGTYEIDELEDAKAKAAEKSRPVVFLYSKKALEPT
jgi:hypothetical protein